MIDNLTQLEHAFTLNPNDAQAANNFACGLILANELDKARDVLQTATLLAPSFWEAWFNLGIVLERMGLPARTAFQHIRIKEDNAAVTAPNMLSILIDQNELDQAAVLLDSIAALEANQSNLYETLHTILFTRRVKIAHTPNVLLHLARMEKQFGQLESAENCLRRIAAIAPSHLHARRELAYLLVETGRFNDALICFQRITEDFPDSWHIWNDAACLLRQTGHIAEAAQWFQQALIHHPDNLVMHANLALIYVVDLHDYEQGQRSLDAVFAINPDYPEALCTQAMLTAGLGQHAQAIEIAQRTLSLKPNYPQMRLTLAFSMLTLGHLREGLAGYESRWIGSDHADTRMMPTIGHPQWHGQRTLPGSHIIILAEQGLGDQLQFARFIPLLLDYFHKITVVASGPLLRLFTLSFKHKRICVVQAPPAQRRDIDFELPLLSLPLVLGTGWNTLPATVPYLHIDANDIAHWQMRLSGYNTAKVGLAWAGGRSFTKDALRSIAPSLLVPLAHPDICFVSLQQIPSQTSSENAAPSTLPGLLEWINTSHDMAHTAALIMNLDLVITVDTAIAHLAGALGKPVWLLNRLGGEWRWLDQREDSPWYPTMRIFNQTEFKDWRPTIKRVAAALVEWNKQR